VQQRSGRDMVVELAAPVDSAQISNSREALNPLDEAVPVEAALPVAVRRACSERWIVHSWANTAIPETSLPVPREVARCLASDQMT